jgi:hypothetical protein
MVLDGHGHRDRVGPAAPGRLAGPAQVLLGGAAACFVVIVAAVGWRGRFVLWDGHDLGSGVLTRRIFV